MKVAVFGANALNFPLNFNFELLTIKGIESLKQNMANIKKVVLAIVQIGTESKEAADFFNAEKIPYIAVYDESSSDDIAWYLRNGAEYILNHKPDEYFNEDILKKYLHNGDIDEYRVFFELTKILRLNLNLKKIIFAIRELIKRLFSLSSIFVINDKYYFNNIVFKSTDSFLRFNSDEKDILEFALKQELFFSTEFQDNKIVVLPIIDKNEILGRVIFIRNSEVNDREFELLNVILSQAAVVIKNYFLLEESKNSYYGIVKALVNAIEAKDEYTKGHTSRVSELSVKLGKKLSLNANELDKLEIAAFLHDVGKIGVKDEILHKKGKLTEEEYNAIKTHPDAGYKIVSEIGNLSDVAEIIRYHHERWDGKGYPESLKGEEIPLEARIVSIVDTYDAITSQRPYRKAASHEEAVIEIEKSAGTQLDPELTKEFIELINNIKSDVKRIV